MISLLADEDVPRSVIEKLRSRGVNVVSVDEDLKGVADREVLSTAKDQGRTVLTYDTDYRSLGKKSFAHPGILIVTRRTDHDRVARTLFEEYLENLEEPDIRNEIIHVTPV